MFTATSSHCKQRFNCNSGSNDTRELSNARDPIAIYVYKDRSKKSDRRVGRIEVSTNIMRKSFAFDRWVPLLEMNDKLSKGELRIKLQYDVSLYDWWTYP